MIWIMPMAGRGERTRALGACKPLVKVQGRFVFEWAILGAIEHHRPGDNWVFITLQEQNAEFGISERVHEICAKFDLGINPSIVELDSVKPGPAASILAARAAIDLDQPCVVINCDHLVMFDFPAKWRVSEKPAAFVPLYVSLSESSSFVGLEDDRIVLLAEKERISHYASAGVYGFSSGRVLMEAIEWLKASNPVEGEAELFVAPAMNYFTQNKWPVYPVGCRIKLDLGTVEGIHRSEAILSKISNV